MNKYEDIKQPKLIDKLRYKTYLEAKELLDIYGKGCIIRPTGFGKTGILTRFIEDIVSKSSNDSSIKIVYIYPNDVVKDAVLSFYYGEDNIPQKREIPNVQFMTYNAIARTPKQKLKKYGDLELIIIDECHKAGAELTSISLKQFLKTNKKAKILGATATPVRMDLIDVIEDYFDNNVTSEYTLHDAFMDGVLKTPYYCYSSYNIKKDVKEIRRKVRKEFVTLDEYSKKIALTVMNKNLKKISEQSKFDKTIREVCDAHAKDTSYMKGIIFCSNFKMLHDNKEEIVQWFKKAYPTHNIRILIVTSENSEYKNNIKKLNKYKYKENTIDLIFSCDMLNMGYHVDNLTFIGMFRLTHSLNIFIQQFGRALSSGDINPTIIFDWVDNIHSPALYSVLDKKSQLTALAKKRFQELKYKIIKKGKSPDDMSVLTDEEQKEYIALKRQFSHSHSSKWWEHTNELYPEDIEVSQHSASYRELISKTVAEPISMRCRQAYANWNEARLLYEKNCKGKVTKKYILEEAFPPEHIPLAPFAKNKQVSVNQILNCIFSDDDNDYHNIYNVYNNLLLEADFKNINPEK